MLFRQFNYNADSHKKLKRSQKIFEQVLSISKYTMSQLHWTVIFQINTDILPCIIISLGNSVELVSPQNWKVCHLVVV